MRQISIVAIYPNAVKTTRVIEAIKNDIGYHLSSPIMHKTIDSEILFWEKQTVGKSYDTYALIENIRQMFENSELLISELGEIPSKWSRWKYTIIGIVGSSAASVVITLIVSAAYAPG